MDWMIKLYLECPVINYTLTALQRRMDFIQLLMDAHKEPDEEKQEDKEHDQEFKKIYKGTSKRSTYVPYILTTTLGLLESKCFHLFITFYGKIEDF